MYWYCGTLVWVLAELLLCGLESLCASTIGISVTRHMPIILHFSSTMCFCCIIVNVVNIVIIVVASIHTSVGDEYPHFCTHPVTDDVITPLVLMQLRLSLLLTMYIQS